MKSVKYLSQLSELTGLNDSDLAKTLGMSKQAISNYKTGLRIMDDEACYKVAEMLGIDHIVVVAAAACDRAEKTGQRSVWEAFWMSRTATAAALLCLSVNLFLTPGKAEAHTAVGLPSNSQAQEICIM
jgi:hypothetical protein